MSSIVPSGDSMREQRTITQEEAAMEWREQARLMREVALLGLGALKAIAGAGTTYSRGAQDVVERMESVLFQAEPTGELPQDQ